MKNILIILAVLVLLLGLIGSFSTLGSTSGGGAGSEETTSASRIEVTEPLPEDDTGLIASYTGGKSDPEGAIILGHISNKSQNETYIGVSFQGLVPGETYTFSFILDMVLMQTLRPSCFYFRCSGSDSSLSEIGIGSFSIKNNGFVGALTFEAKATSAEFFINKIAYTNDSDVISSYGAEINRYGSFALYEGSEVE